mgnify:CR=1 FL=1
MTGYSRRRVLAGVGGVLTLGAAGYEETDDDGEGVVGTLGGVVDGRLGGESGQSPSGLADTDTPTPRPDYDFAETEIQNAAAAYAEKNYEAEYFENIAAFLGDDRVSGRFKDAQVELWLTADEYVEGLEYYDESLTREEMADRWRRGIIEGRETNGGNGFYMDDWTKNGIPHLLPDGTPIAEVLQEEFPEQFNPFERQSAPDKWMHNFYNSTGKVYDIRSESNIDGEASPEEYSFLGFQPDAEEQVREYIIPGPKQGEKIPIGDKVGLKGEVDYRPGIDEAASDPRSVGSIAPYLDADSTPEDLDPTQRNTVLWMDFMQGNRPDPEFRQYMENLFHKAPVEINYLQITTDEEDKMRHQIPTDGHQAIDRFEQTVPKPLQGPVNYSLFVERVEDAGGVGIATELSDSGIITHHTPEKASNWPETENASVAAEEVYGHMVGGMIDNQENVNTIMSEQDGAFNFLESEWESILAGMDLTKVELAAYTGTFYEPMIFDQNDEAAETRAEESAE